MTVNLSLKCDTKSDNPKFSLKPDKLEAALQSSSCSAVVARRRSLVLTWCLGVAVAWAGPAALGWNSGGLQ